jgi:hypothetical protein
MAMISSLNATAAPSFRAERRPAKSFYHGPASAAVINTLNNRCRAEKP